MAAPVQIPLGEHCPHCGRFIQPAHELAELADQAHAALVNRRLAVPDLVPNALASIARDLRCMAGACGSPR